MAQNLKEQLDEANARIAQLEAKYADEFRRHNLLMRDSIDEEARLKKDAGRYAEAYRELHRLARRLAHIVDDIERDRDEDLDTWLEQSGHDAAWRTAREDASAILSPAEPPALHAIPRLVDGYGATGTATLGEVAKDAE